jgi:hypothetical protein
MTGNDLYFQTRAVNSSCLKYIDPDEGGSPARLMHYFKTKKEIVSPWLTMGLTVHKWIEQRDMFSVADFDKPSDAICDIVDLVYNDGVDFDIGDIKSYVDFSGYQKNWKIETRVKKVREMGTEYFNFLKNSEGKIALTASERDTLNGIQEGVMKNSRVSDIIMSPHMDREQEYYFWFVIDDYKVRCKCLLDLSMVKDTNVVYDVKTTSRPLSQYFSYYIPMPSQEFGIDYQIKAGDFFRYRTYRQLALYGKAMERVNGVKPKHYVIVIETKPPYESDVFCVDKYIDIGRHECNRLVHSISRVEGIEEFIEITPQ